MPSPACRSQTLVQQHESCRPRRPAPSPRVPRSRDGSSVRPRRDPRRTDGRCPAPPLTRGRVARGGGTKRGGGPLIASGGPPSRGGGLPVRVPATGATHGDVGDCVGRVRGYGRGGGMARPVPAVGVALGWGGLGPASRPSSGDLGRHPGRAVSGYRRPQARSRDPVPGGPRILTRWCVARGGGAARCAGRRCGPGGAADGLVPPAPAAPDTRRVGPRRRAVPARG